MSWHPASWHDRQLAHVRECIAEADKIHTPEELAAARAFLAATNDDQMQPSLFEAA
ncbi:hypothetical protein ISN76_13085 [Dyella halodurans]|uniref:Uncharacterized protein n=1 Tax=Dyella halodurans TaxID=1920171 RepID=A0ABV9C080_9GAMM|nr:hypothetical protein [Dyella halodurans]